MAIQAIETHYNGYRFRSRLEARWAVFFDAMDEEYRYEYQGYTSHVYAGWNYLPDFWLPRMKIPVEVKGDVSADDMAKLGIFINEVVAIPGGAFALLRDVACQPFDLFCRADHGVWVSSEKIIYHAEPKLWAECPLCHRLAFVCPCEECSGKGEFWWISCIPCSRDKNIKVRSAKYNPTKTPRLLDAYTTARSARFEHGETPKVPRGKPRK